MYYLSILITILANVLYHIFQKQISATVHPFLSLAVTYFVSLLLSISMLWVFPIKDSLSQELNKMNWASIGLALALVGLEIGFLLVYRAGWEISKASLWSNVIVALILIPVGMLLDHEKLSYTNVVGIVLCLLGIVLVKN